MFDTKLTGHLAELSKLAFTEEELETITHEMDDIVHLMDTVAGFNSNEEFAAVDAVKLEDLRADEVKESMARDDILANAKENADTYFKVPKVV